MAATVEKGLKLERTVLRQLRKLVDNFWH